MGKGRGQVSGVRCRGSGVRADHAATLPVRTRKSRRESSAIVYSSGTRVIALVDRAQIITVNVRVELRRREVDVAEHFLNRAEVGAALEEVGRECMTQRVRRDALGEPRPP